MSRVLKVLDEILYKYEGIPPQGFDDGGRVSFANGGIPKGYINLSQLGEKVGLPERIVTHPKTGRRRAIGGLRQRIIDTMTRIPSAERKNLKTKDFIDNVLIKQLDLKKVDLGQGQPTWIIKNPNKTELETMKEYFLRKGFKYGITKETVANMKKFYNDPTLRKYIRKGEFIPDEVLAAKGIGKNQAANITFRLAQHLNGKKFANVDVDLPVNKSLAKKIFKQIEKAPFGNPYQLTAYKEAQNIITNELGSEYFEKTNLESMKREARRILNREGVPTFDPTIKGSSGFNVNEIIGIKTGARVKGLAPYSQFINIMEGKLNTAQYANFVRQFEKFNNRMQTENKSDVIKDYNKYRKTFLKNNPKLKDIDVPKFSLQSPEKIYGKNRINKLAKEGLDFNKSYKEIGYTVDVGKKTRTLKEFITNPKNIARLKKFGKVGAMASAPVVLMAASPSGKGLTTEEVMAQKGAGEVQSKLPGYGDAAITGTGAAIASKFTKMDPLKQVRRFPKNILGKIFRTAGTPLAGPLWASSNIYDKMKEGQSLGEAVMDPLTGLELAFPSLFTENVAKITKNPTAQRILNLGGLQRVLGPVGVGIATVSSLKDRAKAMAERGEDISKLKDIIKQQEEIEDFAAKDYRGYAGGGIAGIRRPHAIPPESGPMPQGGGLSSMFNRVRKW